MLVTYEVADNNLTLSMSSGSLGGSLFGSWATTRLLQVLLNTTDRCSGSGTSGRTALTATTAANSTALGRKDLVKRLVELSRHVGLICCLCCCIKVSG